MIDLHETDIAADDLAYQAVRDKMYAFIFPNSPVTPADADAFETAVQYQYEHDMTQAMHAKGIPEGVQSFSNGDFSMTFAKEWLDARLTRKTICPSAYGVLLRQGLLYRGVEGRC